MAKDKTSLSAAVDLLDETIRLVEKLNVSKGSHGSARELSIRLKKLRELLASELEKPQPSWQVIVELIAEAARWLGRLIDNIQYKFRSALAGLRGSHRWVWDSR